MLPEARGRDLLYVASNDDAVNVYTYPSGRLVGSLGTFNGAGGLCVDKTGDVFISSFYDHAVYEYAHGGTKQLAALGSPYSVNACSVDPNTQDVAAASYFGAIIFHSDRKHGYGFGKYYKDSAVKYGAYCSYDDRGDLFMDGTGQGSGFAMSELPKDGKSFESITLDASINGPGAMQWKGKTVTVADRGYGQGESAIIYRFTIEDGVGTEVSESVLQGSSAYAQFWIQGDSVIGPESGSEAGIGVWDLAVGGPPGRTIAGAPPYGVVVSLK